MYSQLHLRLIFHFIPNQAVKLITDTKKEQATRPPSWMNIKTIEDWEEGTCLEAPRGGGAGYSRYKKPAKWPKNLSGISPKMF